MRWQGRRGSANVEDRRGMGPVAMAGGGIGGLILALLAMFLGVDPGAVPTQAPPPPAETRSTDSEFVSVVLADTEDVWNELFRRAGREYEEPVLVLFEGRVSSACGLASSAVGPFYCPDDRQVYLDLSFFRELATRFDAPGDFAQAYVIAHEVGHHVQHQLGLLDRAPSRPGASGTQVRVELQADFLAGVWAHHAQKRFQILEPGDVEEALNAAAAIGDDRLQREATGEVVPDSFTHGTSEQRVRWFRKGFETGDLDQGDTFRARDL